MSSNIFKVYWNGKLLRTIRPRNYRARWFKINVQSRRGNNRLQFSGSGKSDTKGATFSLVGLWAGRKNYIVNGDFSKPNVGKGWKIFKSIPGWQGGSIEIGRGGIYNRAWRRSYRQVCELDSNRNANVYQIIKF